jgi:hypothetical protein
MTYVNRERIRRWIGPVRCAYRQGKHVLVIIGGVLKAVNLSQCHLAPIPDPNPHHIPPLSSSNISPPSPPTPSSSNPAQQHSATTASFSEPPQLNEAKPADLEAKRRQSLHYRVCAISHGRQVDMDLETEVIEPVDPRTRHFGPAVRKEIEDLVRCGTFRIVLEDDIEESANILPRKLVLAIKSSATGETKYKARPVAGGHRDQDKPRLRHTANTVLHADVRLLMALASIFRLPIASTDVAQAYLQSATKLLRKIYLRGSKHDGIGAVLNIKQGELSLVQLLMPLYGLGDAGDY